MIEPREPAIEAPGDVSPAEFRERAHRLVDWVADYLENGERYPVVARVAPGEIAARLPLAPPASAESLGDILDDFERVVLPGITHWNHPGFLAYFATSGSAPGRTSTSTSSGKAGPTRTGARRCSPRR